MAIGFKKLLSKDKMSIEKLLGYKRQKKALASTIMYDMQLLVYALAVKEMYGNGGPMMVGNWFLRSNRKVFFEPENQAIEAMRTEITEMAAKIKAAAFEPKKGRWECTQCDYGFLWACKFPPFFLFSLSLLQNC